MNYREVIEMAKKIAFINFKGGVGKTTISVELASSLAYHYNKKILLIDMDPQTNATFYLMDYNTWEKHAENGTLKNFFEYYKKVGLTQQPVFDLKNIITDDFNINHSIGRFRPKKLYLIPAHLELMGIEADLAFEIGRKAGSLRPDEKVEGLKRYYEILHLLKKALAKVESDYDYIFFDCPPSIGLLTQNALVASDGYIIPVIPDNLSTIGIPFLEERITLMKDLINRASKSIGIDNEFHGPKRYGIILNRVRIRTWEPLELVSPQHIIYTRLQRNEDLSPFIFKSFISESARVQEPSEEHIPVSIRYGRRYYQSRIQFDNLAKEFLERV